MLLVNVLTPDPDICERFCVMAAVTTCTELSVMFIVSTMAGITGSWLSIDFIHGSYMTAVAMNLFVRPFNLEFRLLVMIETPDFPAIRIMAALTVFAQLAFVFVILVMTAIAFNFCVFITVCYMTFFSRYNGVKTDQWET
jgi:hypothetical protein